VIFRTDRDETNKEMDLVSEMERDGILGIDAGGTFTDLAFLRFADASVAGSAKTPTDHDDLVGTIGRGAGSYLKRDRRQRHKGGKPCDHLCDQRGSRRQDPGIGTCAYWL